MMLLVCDGMDNDEDDCEKEEEDIVCTPDNCGGDSR